jgi:hypothetical protein
MFHVPWPLVVAGLVLACGAQVATAGEYRDPSGYSFRYPGDWMALNRQILASSSGLGLGEARAFLAKNNLDLNQISVVLFHKTQLDFKESLIVIVIPQESPANEQHLQEVKKGLPEQFRAMGITVDNVQAKIARINGCEAMVFEFDTQTPQSPFRLRQRQVNISGPGKSCSIICTAKADSYAQYAPVFDQVITSFCFAGPQEQDFAWRGILLSSGVGAVAGGLAGGLFVLMRKLAARRQADDKPAAYPA